jgi:hypothetical protein
MRSGQRAGLAPAKLWPRGSRNRRRAGGALSPCPPVRPVATAVTRGQLTVHSCRGSIAPIDTSAMHLSSKRAVERSVVPRAAAGSGVPGLPYQSLPVTIGSIAVAGMVLMRGSVAIVGPRDPLRQNELCATSGFRGTMRIIVPRCQITGGDCRMTSEPGDSVGECAGYTLNPRRVARAGPEMVCSSSIFVRTSDRSAAALATCLPYRLASHDQKTATNSR